MYESQKCRYISFVISIVLTDKMDKRSESVRKQLMDARSDPAGNLTFIKLLYPYMCKLSIDDRLLYKVQFLEMLRHFLNPPREEKNKYQPSGSSSVEQVPSKKRKLDKVVSLDD